MIVNVFPRSVFLIVRVYIPATWLNFGLPYLQQFNCTTNRSCDLAGGGWGGRMVQQNVCHRLLFTSCLLLAINKLPFLFSTNSARDQY